MTGAELQGWAAPLGAAVAERRSVERELAAAAKAAKERSDHERRSLMRDMILAVLREQTGETHRSVSDGLPDYAMFFVELEEEIEDRYRRVGEWRRYSGNEFWKAAKDLKRAGLIDRCYSVWWDEYYAILTKLAIDWPQCCDGQLSLPMGAAATAEVV